MSFRVLIKTGCWLVILAYWSFSYVEWEGTDAALAITYVVTAGALDGNINWIGYDEFDEIVAQQTDAAVSGQLTTKGFLSGSVEIRRLKIKIDAFPGWETTADIRVMVAWVRESHIP